MVAADARTAIVFALSPGNEHDAPHGRDLLEELGPMPEGLPLLMDRAYEGNETRQLVLDLGMIPVFRRSPIGCNPGSTIAPFTRSATRSNDCSAGSKDSAASSPASKNWTSSFSHSSALRSSSKRYG
jgi:hypothetical protein